MKLSLPKKHTVFFLIMIILAVASVGFTFVYAVAFSGFAAAFAKAIIGLVLFWLIDRFVFHEIDTLTLIKNGNIAYALIILAYSIILAACIATA